MRERRSEVRLLCADVVRVSWKTPDGKAHKTPALLEDISVSGACLQTETPVPVGVEVRWRSPKKEFRGTVKYCEYQEIGYFVGVEFDRGSKWSRRAFKPQHFLDLEKLLPPAQE